MKNLSSNFYTTIERNNEEIELYIQYSYSPGTPDVQYLPNGDPGYPGDPPEIEITLVTCDGKLFKLTDEEYDKIYDLCFDNADEVGLEQDDVDYP